MTSLSGRRQGPSAGTRARPRGGCLHGGDDPDGGADAGTTSATIPALTAEGLAQLRARALERAWADFGGYKPPCISADIPPELRAALEGFDPPVEYYDPDEDPLEESGEYRLPAR